MAEILVQMGKRGTVVIPAKIRKRLNWEDGCYLTIVEGDAEISFRKIELGGKPDARRELASSILSGAANLGEYLAAIEEVRRMGLEPEEIPHERFGN
jgi:AbrB family looped-hinge helix DNA binding protein